MSLLSVRNLCVNYKTERGTVHAVDGVSLDVAEAQHLGVIGESGCGKTTLLRALVRVLPANSVIPQGEVIYKGRNLLALSPAEMREIRWKEIAMIPQASMDSLDPVQRVGQQLERLLVVRGGYDQRSAKTRAVDLFELVGLEAKRLSNYPHEFSGGMKQRAVIAMALALSPSLLIADEPVTALDVIVQHQILDVLRRLQDELNLTMLLITHDISVVAQVCDSVAVMYAGRIVEQASAETFFAAPSHPYSLGLQQAFPNVMQAKDTLITIEGFPPDLHQPPTGCRFAERCPFVEDRCRATDPQLELVGSKHLAACLRSAEMADLRVAAQDPALWKRSLVGQQYQTVEMPPINGGTSAAAQLNGEEVLVEMKSVSKRYKIGGGLAGLIRGQGEQTIYAVNDLSFKLRRGESLGIAGESGCGKSTTGKLLVKLINPSEGQIIFDGKDLAELPEDELLAFRSRVQLMFQNPFEALNPRFTLYRSLAEPLMIHGWRDEGQRLERIVDTLNRVNLRPAEMFLNKYPHQLSGGQLQRVVLARALVLHPDFIIADEPVSMLDVSVRAGILNTTKRLTKEMGLATVYISHDLSLLRYTCDHIAVMYLGYMVEYGPSDEIINNPKHPYTQALVAAVPLPDPSLVNPPLRIREGVPRPTDLAQGCPFVERCPEALEACRSIMPSRIAIADKHDVLCHLYGEHADSPKLTPAASEQPA
ncbi:MAG: ABC transporter ATP-binding protein [Chloroflexi bacterium]|nr:ABC transporter ATP-binding protein [Chloroflexota bacterium]